MFKEIVLEEAKRRVHFARRLKDLFSSDLSELSAAIDEEGRAAARHLLELRSTTSLALTKISGEVVVKVCLLKYSTYTVRHNEAFDDKNYIDPPVAYTHFKLTKPLSMQEDTHRASCKVGERGKE